MGKKFTIKPIVALSPSELKMHGKDADFARCPVCKQKIYFTPTMLKQDYAYKRKKRNNTYSFYCGWSHYRQDEPKKKLKAKFKDKG